VIAADGPRTERLALRRWRAEDEAALAAIDGDPEVSAFDRDVEVWRVGPR
jgi:hypothetical protein